MWMKTFWTGICLASVMAGSAALAQQGQASAAFVRKIMNEVMQEVPPEKRDDRSFIADKTIEKIRADIDGMKTARITDCVATYGEKKREACECIADKRNLEKQFDFMRKIASGDRA